MTGVKVKDVFVERGEVPLVCSSGVPKGVNAQALLNRVRVVRLSSRTVAKRG